MIRFFVPASFLAIALLLVDLAIGAEQLTPRVAIEFGQTKKPKQETVVSWDFGAKEVRHSTEERDGGVVLVDSRYMIDSKEQIQVQSRIKEEAVEGGMLWHSQTDHIESNRKYQYSIDLKYDEPTALITVTKSAGNVSATSLIDARTGAFVRPFAPNTYERFFGEGGPLYGMNYELTLEYKLALNELLTPSVAQNELIEMRIAKLGGSMKGKHPKWSCLAACAACGGTFFLGPTCERWIDCIEWADTHLKLIQLDNRLANP